MKKMRSIMYDYRWKEAQEGNEITWRYTFIHIYKLSIWLENYLILNINAAKKLIDKVSRKLEDEDKINEIKQIFYSVSFPEMVFKEESMRNEIVEYYAQRFMKGNIEHAVKELDSSLQYKYSYMNSKQDKYVYAVYAVIILLLLAAFLALTYTPKGITHERIDIIHVFFPAFSVSIVLFSFFALVPLVILIFNKFKVNYIYILEMDPQLHYSPFYMFKITIPLIMIWFLILIGYRVSINYFYEDMKDRFYIFSAMILIVLFLFVFWPFENLLHKLRIATMISFVKIFFPIGRNGVKFRDFLLIDIITSFSLALGNLTIAFCLLYCTECKQTNTQKECHGNIAFPILAGLPYLLRFNQCINKLHYTSNKNHLIDAIKYLSLMGEILTNYFYYLEIMPRDIYIAVAIFVAAFASGMDLRIDFNVLHIHSKNFMLRDKLMYPKWFYYFAIVTNLILRFIWCLNLVVLGIKRDYMLLTANMLELLRRFQWILLRVENENLYNIMSYRSFLPVPTLPLH
jgi:hypothetical protein